MRFAGQLVKSGKWYAAEVPVLLVTHDFAEAAALAGEVAVLAAGRVAQRGAPDAIAAAPSSAFVADLVGATVLTGTARADLIGSGYHEMPLRMWPEHLSKGFDKEVAAFFGMNSAHKQYKFFIPQLRIESKEFS